MKDVLIGAWLGALTLGFLAGFAELLERIDETNSDIERLDRQVARLGHDIEAMEPQPETPNRTVGDRA